MDRLLPALFSDLLLGFCRLLLFLLYYLPVSPLLPFLYLLGSSSSSTSFLFSDASLLFLLQLLRLPVVASSVAIFLTASLFQPREIRSHGSGPSGSRDSPVGLPAHRPL